MLGRSVDSPGRNPIAYQLWLDIDASPHPITDMRVCCSPRRQSTGSAAYSLVRRVDDSVQSDPSIGVLREIPVIVKTKQMVDEIENLNNFVRSNQRVQSYMDDPAGKCFDAMCALAEPLYEAGYKPRYRGVGIWDDVDGSDIGFRNHFVIIAEKDGVAYAVDPTAAQFPDLGINEPIVDIEENWAAKYVSHGNALFKYQDHFTPNIAGAFGSSMAIGRPDDSFGGATVPAPVPQWYEALMLRKQQEAREAEQEARASPGARASSVRRHWLLSGLARVPGMMPKQGLQPDSTTKRARLRRFIWHVAFNVAKPKPG